MLGCHLQTSRGVILDDGLEVWRRVEQVVAYAAADECTLYALRLANLAVELQQWRVVVVHIGTQLRVQTRRTAATSARLLAGIRKLYHVPEDYIGTKYEYAVENGFKQLVEPPMPVEGYWTPEWTETDTQLICNWVEIEEPKREFVSESTALNREEKFKFPVYFDEINVNCIGATK